MPSLEKLGRLLSAAASARGDRHTMDGLGIPSLILMERAALAVAHEIRERYAAAGREVVVLAGPGNNGGDGLAAARQLCGWGIPARVHLCTERRNDVVDAQIRLARALGVEVVEGLPSGAPADQTIVVDALLGTGSTGAPRGAIAEALDWLAAARGPKVAIDVPTGVDPDAGVVLGRAAAVDLTVTMQSSKPGLHITPGRDHAGIVVVADIGLVAAPGEGEGERADAVAWLISPWAVRERAAAGDRAAHKGERGHVGVLGGSPGTPGAAILAATAALRCGAGLVTAAALDPAIEPLIIGSRPELMVERLDPGAWGERPLARADVLIVGPGLTRAADRQELARLWREDPRPAIWDASSLDEIPPGGDARPAAVRILTPHPGEAQRLLERLGDDAAIDVRRERRAAARALARRTGAIVVLKGAGTLVDDGARLAIAVSGGPGLATAGSGDCLTGFIAALLAGPGGREEPFAAACGGVHLHGVAGELAVADGPGALALDIAALAGAAKGAPPSHRRWPQLRLN
ncbi:MAG: NAD(P)H-hydrate dehydratase [Nannocystaceae bacterium]